MAQLFDFLFLPYLDCHSFSEGSSIKPQLKIKRQCAAVLPGTKTMTKIDAERMEWGESNRAMPGGMVECCERGKYFTVIIYSKY